jgi:tyrosinase
LTTYRVNIEFIQSKPDELKKLRDGYVAYQQIDFTDDRGFSHLAGYHGFPGNYCWHHQRDVRVFLRARLFLPWHRAYLYHFEKKLQIISGVPNLGIPWWDWTSDLSKSNGIPKAFSEEKIGVKANPLFNTKFPLGRTFKDEFDKSHSETWRGDKAEGLDTIQRLIPARKELEEQIKTRTDYGDFSDYLEDIHDAIHGAVGGAMSNVPSAAFDPIFWSHHAMIDRIWYKWQLQHGFNKGLENMMNISLPPTGLIVRDTIRIAELQYEYADSLASVSG